jgi:hypothetical protein
MGLEILLNFLRDLIPPTGGVLGSQRLEEMEASQNSGQATQPRAAGSQQQQTQQSAASRCTLATVQGEVQGLYGEIREIRQLLIQQASQTFVTIPVPQQPQQHYPLSFPTPYGLSQPAFIYAAAAAAVRPGPGKSLVGHS